MITRVVGKRRTAPMQPDALAELRAQYPRPMVDVGTGDAYFAYHLASQSPDRLVIGVDALDEPMGETAHKAGRKPARGGRPNLVLVRAAAESLPAELHHVADDVYVQLPWGRLLEGIVVPDAAVIDGLAALCAPGARIEVTLNGEIWDDSLPVRYEHLPVPTPEHVANVVAPAFARAGIDIGPARLLTPEEVAALATTWSRRLAHGRPHAKFLRFAGTSR